MPPKEDVEHRGIFHKKPATSVAGLIIEKSACRPAGQASVGIRKNQAKAGRVGWIRTRRYTARINNNPRTQAVPAAKMGMLKEVPPADTEAHSVHMETSSFPTAELEAQLGQQVFMGQILLIGNSVPIV